MINFAGIINAIYVAPNASISLSNVQVTGPANVQLSGTNASSPELLDLPFLAGSPVYPSIINDVDSTVSTTR